VAGIAAISELRNPAAAELAVAQRSDDAGLRALLRRQVLPGAVRVAFTREPDYFAGEGQAGSDDTTLVARRSGRVVGMGRCSVNALHRNGTACRIGYLAELRVEPGTPATPSLLRDGYALLRQQAGSVDGFFTSISSDNGRARRVLERGARFGLPAYRKLCDLVTLVAPLRAQSIPPAPSEATDSTELESFLASHSQRAHLTLAWQHGQWRGLARHGVTTDSFVTVRSAGRVAGAAAIWDQRPFRQITVDGYETAIGLARPLVNQVQALVGGTPLPSPGDVLAQGMLSGACVESPHDWSLLWPALEHRAHSLGLSWLAVSREARDPELAVLRRLTNAREYNTTLYGVAWSDGPRWPDGWDSRFFRPEVALL
jgi:hypothetical protein